MSWAMSENQVFALRHTNRKILPILISFLITMTMNLIPLEGKIFILTNGLRGFKPLFALLHVIEQNTLVMGVCVKGGYLPPGRQEAEQGKG